tara:strand:+ start:115 stop:402 length:288 start_codon:yes stop_codon:yes gene_type:complete
MEVKINLLTNKSKVIKYLTRKEVWVHGFLRYNQLKKMISHITKINSNYELRRLFLYLVEEGVFIKKKNSVRSYMYMFKNPNSPRVENKTIVITFD